MPTLLQRVLFWGLMVALSTVAIAVLALIFWLSKLRFCF